MFDAETIKEFAKQGAGVLLGVVMFTVWVKFVLDQRAAARATEERLVGIVKDRKSDRDELLKLMGRIAGQLDRDDAFKDFAQQALDNAHDAAPKRRALDKSLADALAKVERDQS